MFFCTLFECPEEFSCRSEPQTQYFPVRSPKFIHQTDARCGVCLFRNKEVPSKAETSNFCSVQIMK